MSIARGNRRVRYSVFVLLMLSINVIDGLVMRSITDPGRRMAVAIAASFDVIVVVSALYYWLLVRPRIRARGSLVAIALIGALHATYFYSNATAARAAAAGLCETGLIGFLVIRMRRARRSGAAETDPIGAIRAAVESVVTIRSLANLITAELSILYYALFSWHAKPHVGAGTRAFTIYQRAGQADLLAILPIACVLELVPVHLLLNQWSTAAAWAATGASLYSVIWLIGLTRAFRLRPVLVGYDHVYLRYGLLFQLHVPREFIARVRPAQPGDTPVPRKSEPTLCVELVQAMDAEGIFGMHRRVRRIGLTPDDERGLKRALTEMLPAE